MHESLTESVFFLKKKSQTVLCGEDGSEQGGLSYGLQDPSKKEHRHIGGHYFVPRELLSPDLPECIKETVSSPLSRFPYQHRRHRQSQWYCSLGAQK